MNLEGKEIAIRGQLFVKLKDNCVGEGKTLHTMEIPVNIAIGISSCSKEQNCYHDEIEQQLENLIYDALQKISEEICYKGCVNCYTSEEIQNAIVYDLEEELRKYNREIIFQEEWKLELENLLERIIELHDSKKIIENTINDLQTKAKQIMNYHVIPEIVLGSVKASIKEGNSLEVESLK